MGEMGGNEEGVVAFLGPKASYTHQATLQSFPSDQYTITPLTSIEDVFSAVQNGTANYGVVPFENSSNGSVVFTLDLFADTAGKFPEIIVVGEIYLPVHHCLLGRINPAAKDSRESSQHQQQTALLSRHSHLKDDVESPLTSGQVTPTQSQPQPLPARTKPLHDLSHIRKLYSHPQAWGQCKTFLSTYLKNVERQDVSSTSKAAELVAATADNGDDSKDTVTVAAISSHLAAELHGLDILASGIEDSEGNSTRFLILRNPQLHPIPPPSTTTQHQTPSSNNEGKDSSNYKTLLSFTISHHSPGALADSLAVFKKHHLNLTSINTRPSGVRPWQYVFFIELMGRRRVEGQGGEVDAALRELEQVVLTWRWLGSWERAELG